MLGGYPNCSLWTDRFGFGSQKPTQIWVSVLEQTRTKIDLIYKVLELGEKWPSILNLIITRTKFKGWYQIDTKTRTKTKLEYWKNLVLILILILVLRFKFRELNVVFISFFSSSLFSFLHVCWGFKLQKLLRIISSFFKFFSKVLHFTFQKVLCFIYFQIQVPKFKA